MSASESDAEMAAIWSAYNALKPLDRLARYRAIAWLQHRLEHEMNRDSGTPRDNVVKLADLSSEVPF